MARINALVEHILEMHVAILICMIYVCITAIKRHILIKGRIVVLEATVMESISFHICNI